MKTNHHQRMKTMVVMILLAGLITGLKADAPAPKKGNVTLKSLTSIAFNKDGILFLADPLGTHVYAIETQGATQPDPDKITVANIDEKVAALLGVQVKDIKIADMAVHPISKEIYLAVTRNGSPAQSVLIKCDHKGNLRAVALNDVSFYETSITDVPAPGTKLPQQWHTLTMAVTDMAFVDGELFVSGLSGEQFSSKMRRFAFPFTNQSQAVQLEIFHTSHDIYETRSPIETFLPFPINGQMHILAGYGCSPVAKFSLQDIRSKSQLRGITLAELGGGNRPVDMIAYKKEGKDYVLIANSDRTMMRMTAEDLNKGQPLTTVVPGAYVNAGVNYLAIAEVGVMQLDDFNEKNFIVIQRNINDGSLNLKTMEKWF
jgi:hypothetical protein